MFRLRQDSRTDRETEKTPRTVQKTNREPKSVAYFNLHKMPKLIFQLNLIVENSLDESIKVVPYRPQCSLIDCTEGEQNYNAPVTLQIHLHTGDKNFVWFLSVSGMSCEHVKEETSPYVPHPKFMKGLNTNPKAHLHWFICAPSKALNRRYLGRTEQIFGGLLCIADSLYIILYIFLSTLQ